MTLIVDTQFRTEHVKCLDQKYGDPPFMPSALCYTWRTEVVILKSCSLVLKLCICFPRRWVCFKMTLQTCAPANIPCCEWGAKQSITHAQTGEEGSYRCQWKFDFYKLKQEVGNINHNSRRISILHGNKPNETKYFGQQEWLLRVIECPNLT